MHVSIRMENVILERDPEHNPAYSCSWAEKAIENVFPGVRYLQTPKVDYHYSCFTDEKQRPKGGMAFSQSKRFAVYVRFLTQVSERQHSVY